ncbi:hypothetical protein MNBD_ALPHA11-240, partial [hydrothermal vent metagenome]
YSVVIPAYNASRFILDSIDSILAQSHPPAHIIVVDDGSTDDLADTLTSSTAPLTLIHQENSGPGTATSRGMAAVKTEFIASLDADDLWEPEKIATQFGVLQNPDISIVFTRMRSFGETNAAEPADECKSGWSRSTLLMRREVFTQVGDIVDLPGFRGDMVDWIARARMQGIGIEMLENYLAKRRVHKGSLSWSRDPALNQGYMEVVRRAMQRRKENGG